MSSHARVNNVSLPLLRYPIETPDLNHAVLLFADRVFNYELLLWIRYYLGKDPLSYVVNK